jgi:hexokinase
MNLTDEQWKELKFSPEDLEDIRKTMAARIREGLKSEGGEIKALATYLPPPAVDSGGTAIVIDIGGTNIRAAIVSFSPKGKVILEKGPAVTPLLPNWDRAEDFFCCQSDLALSLSPPPGLPIGYCFSYPTTATPDRDGILIRWNKQLKVPDVVGKKVGELLLSAFRERGYRSSGIAILNDTVAALLGADLEFGAKGEFSDFIGLIVGTGTNMAAYLPTRLLSVKLFNDDYAHERMAVNLESGNFSPPHLSRFDYKLDATRKNSGLQLMEKTVSGRFIPQIFSFIKEGRTAPPYPKTRDVFDLAYKNGDSPDGVLALTLINRSADLVAGGLAGLIDILNSPGKVGILAEGGVINNNPEYYNRVREKLAGLLQDNPRNPTRFALLQMENANLIGAAAAAI